MPASEITPGCQVTLHFSLTLADGTEAISTFDEAPLSCRLGEGAMAEPLEACLIGLSVGSETLFLLSGDEVFGPASEENIQLIPKTDFPMDMSVSPGKLIAFSTPGGHELAGIIRELNDNDVLVDFNHPLAGQSISFKVKILAVEPAS